jgi:hypothetical protein
MGFHFDRSDLGLLVTLGLIVLSGRLLRLFLRTRRLPELLVAVYFLVAPLGISLSIRIPRFDPQYAGVLRATTAALFSVGGAAFLLFAWSAFRPQEAWAKGLAFCGSALLAATWGLGVASGGFERDMSIWLRLPPYLSYVWVFVESLRYHLLLRRRERLGLADPVLVNRFLLFAVFTGGVVVITALGVASALLAELRGGGFREENSFTDPTILALTRLLALPIAVSLWLTFLAPARYQAWLRSRAARRAAA